MAKNKAQSAFREIKRPLIIEDTSLHFNAFSKGIENGLPGVYIKWFWKALDDEGLSKLLDGFEDKKAIALSTCIYIESDEKDPIIVQKEFHGVIVRPRGPPGTGAWNSIFLPDGEALTLAEMNDDTRYSIFHRTRCYIEILKKIEETIPNTKIKTA